MKNLSYGPSKLTPSNYSSFSFGLATFSSPENNVVEAKKGFHSCREGLLSSISSDLDTINTDKAHMLLKWDASAGDQSVVTANKLLNQKWIEKGVNLLHFYEKMAGWPLTKIYEVKTGKDSIKVYYFLSSRRWIKAPYLISLYILLIRIGKLDHFENFKTYDDLVKITNKISASSLKPGDERYIADTFKYWKTIVKNYAELFRKRKIEYYWSTERLTTDSYVGYEGIAYLSKGDTHNSKLYEKFMALHKEG
ncbi:MAG: hypothetical protein E3J47_08225 [Candidatus Stahlbacteria bacterium]|nr:MAG: hypothetical protein E3J47_08225 [Candidatus Stahlbacteria bacterium]